MKITCQACQSKYTIADDKIQGKVAKIRCRKCGATVLVDASSAAGAQANGSAAAAGEAWSVSVAEGDQRTMQLYEVVDAYNNGVITGETYLWKEGMGDWLQLAEVTEIVAALNEGNAEVAAEPIADYSAPAQDRVVPGLSPPVSAVAARRETGRGRGDLFSSRVADEEVATSVPAALMGRGSNTSQGGSAAAADAHAGGLTGARDEHSVLFSLSALTGGGSASAKSVSNASAGAGAAKNDDSGLIDLNALARAQQARPTEASAAQLAVPTPFMFPAALGTVEVPQAPEPTKKSSMPLLIGGGIAIAGIAIGIALLTGGKKDEVPVAPVATAVLSAPAPVESVAAAPAAEEPSAADSAGAAASSAKVFRKAPPAGPRPAAKPAAAAPVAAPAALPAPKPKNPCGCAGGDLQCQIRCSATGH